MKVLLWTPLLGWVIGAPCLPFIKREGSTLRPYNLFSRTSLLKPVSLVSLLVGVPLDTWHAALAALVTLGSLVAQIGLDDSLPGLC